MFKGLQKKWNVNGFQLILILATFAIGGSLCGLASRRILGLFLEQKNALWFLSYLVLITILWPLCVIIISFPFGQFAFFKNYLTKVFARLTGKKNTDNKQ